MAGLTIGKVAERAGVKIDTLLYYERQGVIAPPERIWVFSPSRILASSAEDDIFMSPSPVVFIVLPDPT